MARKAGGADQLETAKELLRSASPQDGRVDGLVLPHVNADCVQIFLGPPYSPELNPQEHVWDELRENHFHNRIFESIDALEDHLVVALRDLENDPHRVKSITGWDWIINAVSNAN